LPDEGYICVAMLLPQGGFRHYFCETHDHAQAQIDALENAGHTVYLAQATFDREKIDEAQTHNAAIPRGLPKAEYTSLRKKLRSQENALLLRSFFFDIDCGPDKDYPDQKTAVAALKEFVAQTKLPMPTVSSSGNGLYAHWLIEEMIPAENWRTTAYLLKQVAAGLGFKADPSRTADSASVLRPPGTTNRKPGKEAKPVRLLKLQPASPYALFSSALNKAGGKLHLDTTKTSAPKPSKDLNQDFASGIGDTPSSIVQVAERCQQVKLVRDKKGNVSEPLWYAVLGVMIHCTDGWDLIQEWSSGHPDYSPSVTTAKAQHYQDSAAGPSTCVKLSETHSELCIGCIHNGKIKSPIALGRPEPVSLEITEKNLESAPGFRRSETGLYYEEDGRWTRFYDQDLYVDRVAYDSSLGYQVAVIKHCLPFEGCMEFMIRSSLIHDHKALMIAMSDNHVHVIGQKEKKVMSFYIEGHLAKLQRQQKMTVLCGQMGWKTNNDGSNMFVLGKKMFQEDGSIEEASLARHVPSSAQGYRSQGDVNKWVEATALLNKPGMEPYAFALLCGFAAPLMKFTGFDGALVSLVGDSGVGKTLMLRWVQSIYGQHNELMMLRDDTRNALVSRLGVYGNLPLTVDEITNIDGQELSDLVYRVTQGRDKARLTKNAEERKVVNAWNTLALVTTNSSLADKLSGVKHDASAELNRVFEYYVPRVEEFSGETTAELYWTIHNNFGGAGERYIQWIATNIHTITPALEKVQKKINAATSMRGDERFWSAIIATAVYGGIVAQKLGLVKFEVSRVMAWAEKQVSGMRNDKEDLAEDAVGILAQFIDAHVTNRLIVRGSAIGGKDCLTIEAPRGALVMRHELDTDRLYISRTVFKAWVAKRFGSYNRIRTDLQNMDALKNANRQKSLGGGTQFSGAVQACWEIDLKCRKLGAVGIQLVAKAAATEPIIRELRG